LSTRLRISVTFAVVTDEGGTIREKSYGNIIPDATVYDVDPLAGIVHNTVTAELPVFLKAR